MAYYLQSRLTRSQLNRINATSAKSWKLEGDCTCSKPVPFRRPGGYIGLSLVKALRASHSYKVHHSEIIK